MTTPAQPPGQGEFTFLLNGQPVTACPGETILQVAERSGVSIPRLCYHPDQHPDGNCRSCVVEIEGERTLAPACCRQARAEMRVSSDSPRVYQAQQTVLELLLSDTSPHAYRLDSELSYWADQRQASRERFPSRRQRLATDISHPAIAVNLDACIHCSRCLRACREVQVNDVIGWHGRGAATRVAFDLNDRLGDSSCVACGECVQACPTGALSPANGASLEHPDREVDSVCPYCGVGCLLTYQVKDDQLLGVVGRDGATNHNRLCVKGRFGFDYISHPQRLTKPLIRRPGVPRQDAWRFDPARPGDYFREASWEEALDAAARGFLKIREQQGGNALAGFGSAKGSNEEAYLFQKLVRTGFGSNNVDHCTRLCHASSVAALLEGIGSGAVSNPVADITEADLLLVIGANPESNHPVAATWMKNAVKAGKTLILADPRQTPLARHATHFLQFQPDSDVALLNALIYCIIDEQLYDAAFVASRTEGFAEFQESIAPFSPEAMAPLCGIAAERLRNIARLYARAQGAMIFWGMGVSQHIHGTDNARCLIALALLCGQIGRPGTGLHPLRGQNNVQGASDAGLIPMVFPDYQRVDDPEARQRFEALWNTTLDPQPGLTVVEIMHAARAGAVRGLYVMGENPAMSDPNLNETRAALANLQHLVVQDLFLTETAAYADVILPASAFPEKTGTFTNTDRRVQLGRQALPLPGDTQQDLWIIQQLAARLGLNWHYPDVSAVFEEMRTAMPSIAGISWERLQREDSVTYPCGAPEDPGQAVLFQSRFPTASGRARLVPTRLISAAELPDSDYPLVLLTGRQLEHWHTGSMTRRSRVLDSLEPTPWVALHPTQLHALQLREQEPVLLQSRRGTLKASVRSDPGLLPGQVFMPFCYVEAAANLLTNDALDPFGKIAEVKYCAVRVKRA